MNNNNFFKSLGVSPLFFIIVNGYLLASFGLYIASVLILHKIWNVTFAQYYDVVIYSLYGVVSFIVYKFHFKNVQFISIRQLNIKRNIFLACLLVFIFSSFKFGIQYLSDDYLNIVLPRLYADSTPIMLLLHSIIAITIGPILEEIIFRGFIYTSLRNKFSAFISIFISAFVFSFWHLGGKMMTLINILFVGIFLAYLYEKSKSLIPSIIAHILINMNWIATIVFKYFQSDNYIIQPKTYVFILMVINVSLAILFYFLFRSGRLRVKPSNNN